MNTQLPKVSVILPAYNQAQYLDGAIQSVLSQTFKSYEIIVVDDGSTDDTPLIAQRYGSSVRYVRQKNQGLAGARNTGIRQAHGDYIALLDADDLWMPTFLSEMMALTEKRPEASVYYCGVNFIDPEGHDLPQPGQSRIIPPEDFYYAILRTNFLIPSTIVMNRTVIMAEGLFDVTFRRLQDWELWIRLLRRGYSFAGHGGSLVRYRVHGRSLSTDPAGGQKAARELVEKHFGLDDGQRQTWPDDKRKAYGGLYWYLAVTTSLVRQGDWQACGSYLQKAFQVDPPLTSDLSLFYELALGTQPLGHRSASVELDLIDIAKKIEKLLKGIYQKPLTLEMKKMYSRSWGTANYSLGLVAYNQEKFPLSRRFLILSLRHRPELWHNRKFVNTFVRSFVGRRGMNWLRKARISLRPAL